MQAHRNTATVKRRTCSAWTTRSCWYKRQSMEGERLVNVSEPVRSFRQWWTILCTSAVRLTCTITHKVFVLVIVNAQLESTTDTWSKRNPAIQNSSRI